MKTAYIVCALFVTLVGCAAPVTVTAPPVVETHTQTPMLPKIRIIFDQTGKKLPQPLEVDLSNSAPGNPERNLVAPADPLLFDLDPAEFL